MAKFSFENLKRELIELSRYLKSFLRHPVNAIKHTPTLTYPAMFSVQGGAAMVSGALLGLMSHSVIDVILGILIFPISSVVLSFVFALFIYYYFSLFHSTFLEFRRLYAIVVLANLPYFIFHVASGYLPPIDLLGFAFASVLLIVGLVEQFGLERKTVLRLIGILYLVFFVIWGVALFRSSGSTFSHRTERETTPRSLDELEKEL